MDYSDPQTDDDDQSSHLLMRIIDKFITETQGMLDDFVAMHFESFPIPRERTANSNDNLGFVYFFAVNK
jgi:hypothetical protein